MPSVTGTTEVPSSFITYVSSRPARSEWKAIIGRPEGPNDSWETTGAGDELWLRCGADVHAVARSNAAPSERRRSEVSIRCPRYTSRPNSVPVDGRVERDYDGPRLTKDCRDVLNLAVPAGPSSTSERPASAPMKGPTMRASIVRSFLIALVTASLFGAVPAAAGNETPSGSTVGVLDTSGATAPGATLWSDRYTLVGTFSDLATALATSPDGSEVFVTGTSDGSGTGNDYATVAYDASTGATLWSGRYNGPGNISDRPSDVAVSPDGSAVFVTGTSGGRSTSGDLNYDYATVAYDTSTGAQLWVRRYASRGDRTDAATALGVSPDGSRVFVTGGSAGPTSDDDDFATMAYDASTGTKLWAKRYSRLGNDFAYALGVTPDGSEVIVSGHSFGSTSYYDYATVAYDVSTGATLWSKRYTGPGNGLDSPRAVGVSPDGSAVFVTGLSDGSGPDPTTPPWPTTSPPGPGCGRSATAGRGRRRLRPWGEPRRVRGVRVGRQSGDDQPRLLHRRV